jgi:HTH-type transcriptional regulator, transcriptional repressor of NAD biosynthesis genes
MVRWAAARTERLVVFVNSSAERDTVPGQLRAAWLADLHPDVAVVEVRHRLGTDFDDEDLWRRWMTLFSEHWPHDDGPHAVFSSDAYVVELAARFGAEHVVVDPERRTVPISATQIRQRPADHLERLAPPVRAWVESNWL